MEIRYVVLEYFEEIGKVNVRGVFSTEEKAEAVAESSVGVTNVVSCFVDTDMGRHVGFSGLYSPKA